MCRLETQICPTFQKSVLCHVAFMKDLQWYLFSPTGRNPKRMLTFAKIAFSAGFAASHYGDSKHLKRPERPGPALYRLRVYPIIPAFNTGECYFPFYVLFGMNW